MLKPNEGEANFIFKLKGERSSSPEKKAFPDHLKPKNPVEPPQTQDSQSLLKKTPPSIDPIFQAKAHPQRKLPSINTSKIREQTKSFISKISGITSDTVLDTTIQSTRNENKLLEDTISESLNKQNHLLNLIKQANIEYQDVEKKLVQDLTERTQKYEEKLEELKNNLKKKNETLKNFESYLNISAKKLKDEYVCTMKKKNEDVIFRLKCLSSKFTYTPEKNFAEDGDYLNYKISDLNRNESLLLFIRLLKFSLVLVTETNS